MAKHTILFLAANPFGTDRLALDEEARAIRMALERSGQRDRFALETRWAARPSDLLDELRKLKPTIVHFSGHGGSGVASLLRAGGGLQRDVVGAAGDVYCEAQHGLYFQGPDGRPRLVSTAALKETFEAAGSSVRLVILNACYSDGYAEALLPHVDCVVGMNGSIGDDIARTFAIGFHGALGERESIASAYRHGLALVGLEGLSIGERAKLSVRNGVDAEKLVLAENPPGIQLPAGTHSRNAYRVLDVGRAIPAILATIAMAIVMVGLCSRTNVASQRDLVSQPIPVAPLENTSHEPVARPPASSISSTKPSPLRSLSPDKDKVAEPPRSREQMDCMERSAAPLKCSYRGTLRNLKGEPLKNIKVELVGTDCIVVTNNLGIFDFAACSANQTTRLSLPRIYLHLASGSLCHMIPLHMPPLVTEVRIDPKQCDAMSTMIVPAWEKPPKKRPGSGRR